MDLQTISNGKLRQAGDVELADKALEMKKNKGLWDTLGLLVNAWMKKTPEDFEGFKLQIDAYRDGLFDSKYGQTAGGKDMERRFTIVFPEKLFFMIRSLYKSTELTMDRKFYTEFATRFPIFKIPEKL